MDAVLDRSWADAVCAVCDPVMERAEVGFTRQLGFDEQGLVQSLLWEADPTLFAARYPDSDIIDSYGSGWAGVHCIDYWIYVDAGTREARTSVEGWSWPDAVIPLTGEGRRDGLVIGELLARILRVDGPS